MLKASGSEGILPPARKVITVIAKRTEVEAEGKGRELRGAAFPRRCRWLTAFGEEGNSERGPREM